MFGYVGITLALLSYVALTYLGWKPKGVLYQGANFLAAGLNLAYAWSIGASPYVLFNLIWIAISIDQLLGVSARVRGWLRRDAATEEDDGTAYGWTETFGGLGFHPEAVIFFDSRPRSRWVMTAGPHPAEAGSNPAVVTTRSSKGWVGLAKP